MDRTDSQEFSEAAQESLESAHGMVLQVGGTGFTCAAVFGGRQEDSGDGGWIEVQTATVRVLKSVLSAPVHPGRSVLLGQRRMRVERAGGYGDHDACWTLYLRSDT
jgi:hypothetical protein